MSSEYQYLPLDTPTTLRLIEVLPPGPDGFIVCILRQSDQHQDQDLKYCALSYQWGDSSPTRKIHLGNSSVDTCIHGLHENLWQFLRHVSDTDRSGQLFWTDSLCLNQKDQDELRVQVPRMGDIYSLASEVLVWLGHEPECEGALRLVSNWPGEVNWTTADIGDERAMVRAAEAEDMRVKVAKAAEKLLLLPYWSRVWIVQEVVLAHKVTVASGYISMDLDDFQAKLDPFRDLRSEFNYLPTIWTLCNMRAREGKKQPLWELIKDFELCQSTRTVDKIYGFLGLVASEGDQNPLGDLLGVSYEKQPNEVFWDAVFECRAPWNEYPGVLISLGHQIWQPGQVGTIDADIGSLERYAASERTSSDHKTLANVALRVVDAIYSLALRASISNDGPFWVQFIDSFLETPSPYNEPGPIARLHNAGVVGLAVTSRRVETYDSWKQYRLAKVRQEKNLGYIWRCENHQTVAQMGQASRVVERATGAKSKISCDPTDFYKICDKSSQYCGGLSLLFSLEPVGLRIVISLSNEESLSATLFLTAV